MKSNILAAGIAFGLGLAVNPGTCAADPPASRNSVPVRMTECEGKNDCATWTFLGNQGTGQWPSGELASLTLESLQGDDLVIHRADSTGPSAGLTVEYKGTRHGERVSGEFTSHWPGHWESQSGDWYAMLEKSSQNAPSTAAVTLRGVVHVQEVGDSPLQDAVWAGSKGQSRRLEGFSLEFEAPQPGLGIEYTCHVEGIGDLEWMPGGSFCGTRGQSRRVEGFAIRLTGVLANQYDVVYSCHIEAAGDMGPLRNGAFCGTKGQSRRVEAMQVHITPGDGRPGPAMQPLAPLQRQVIVGPIVCVPWFFTVVCGR